LKLAEVGPFPNVLKDQPEAFDMKPEEFANDQLKFTYSRIQFDREASSKLRNWCVTVWLASLALVNSDKLHLTMLQHIALPVLPLLFFWALDALQNTFIFIHSMHARTIERFLLGREEINAARLEDLTLENAIHQVPYWRKIKILFRVAFFAETVFIFYIALIAVTLIFYFLLA
jgi:hypothetical protein